MLTTREASFNFHVPVREHMPQVEAATDQKSQLTQLSLQLN